MYNEGQGLFLLTNRSFIMYLYDCAHSSSLVEKSGGGGGGGQQQIEEEAVGERRGGV